MERVAKLRCSQWVLDKIILAGDDAFPLPPVIGRHIYVTTADCGFGIFWRVIPDERLGG